MFCTGRVLQFAPGRTPLGLSNQRSDGQGRRRGFASGPPAVAHRVARPAGGGADGLLRSRAEGAAAAPTLHWGRVAQRDGPAGGGRRRVGRATERRLLCAGDRNGRRSGRQRRRRRQQRRRRRQRRTEQSSADGTHALRPVARAVRQTGSERASDSQEASRSWARK